MEAAAALAKIDYKVTKTLHRGLSKACHKYRWQTRRHAAANVATATAKGYSVVVVLTLA